MTETLELEPDAFWREVTEHDLKVSGPSAGYMWTGKRGVAGWEVYKTRAQPIGWLYQARRVCTQNAVGGGALTVRITLPTGTTAKLKHMYVQGPASAGATLVVGKADEDGAVTAQWASIAAGASRVAWLPSIGSAASTNNNLTDSLEGFVGPGEIVYAAASAALQTETMTIAIELLLSTNSVPTWDTTGSAGTPVLAASTISAANTSQAVYL